MSLNTYHINSIWHTHIYIYIWSRSSLVNCIQLVLSRLFIACRSKLNISEIRYWDTHSLNSYHIGQVDWSVVRLKAPKSLIRRANHTVSYWGITDKMLDSDKRSRHFTYYNGKTGLAKVCFGNRTSHLAPRIFADGTKALNFEASTSETTYINSVRNRPQTLSWAVQSHKQVIKTTLNPVSVFVTSKISTLPRYGRPERYHCLHYS